MLVFAAQQLLCRSVAGCESVRGSAEVLLCIKCLHRYSSINDIAQPGGHLAGHRIQSILDCQVGEGMWFRSVCLVKM